jgi:protein-disulfide isomerase
MQAKGLSFPVALDDANYTLAQAFGIQAFPTIFFVNADGVVQQANEGEMPNAELQQAIQNLLAVPQSG